MKRNKRSARKEYLKLFKEAVKEELREHKSSFIVFWVLRFLVIVSFIRQICLHNYEGAFFCALALLLLYLPSLIQVKLHIELPPLLESIILFFIFAAEILGEVNAFYIEIPIWDTLLHTLNGFLAAAVGFSLVWLLNADERLTFDLSPLFLVIVAFSFSMTIGVLWEFFEFTMDMLVHSDMQKDIIINNIYTVALDVTRSNKVVALKDITHVLINGKDLGLGGYLDIGLIDTMKDLLVNFIGAIVFSLIGYLYLYTHGKKGKIFRGFLPQKKTAAEDHLTILLNNRKIKEK